MSTNSWPIVSLRRITEVIDCAHLTAPFVDENQYPVVSIRECASPAIDLTGCNHTTAEFFKLLRDSGRTPRTGDLVFIRNVSVGLVSIVTPETPKFALGQETVLIRQRSSSDSRFLRYSLTSRIATHAIESAMVGATFRRINVSAIRALPVPVPPLDEQLVIANFLDHETAQIDALVAKQNELIALLRERRTSQTADILAGLGMPNTQLRRVARIQTGVTLSGNKDPNLPSWPYLRVANVQMGHVDLSEIKTIHLSERDAFSSILRAGDVLMTEGGDIDKLGRGTVWDGLISPMLHQNHVFAARPAPGGLLPKYLALWLDSPTAREYFYLTAKKTTNLASTNKTIVGRLPICVPSIEQQKSVIQRHSHEVGRIDALITKAQEHIAFANERRAALITAAVTGQINVRGARKAG